jgi:hypothetical protein
VLKECRERERDKERDRKVALQTLLLWNQEHLKCNPDKDTDINLFMIYAMNTRMQNISTLLHTAQAIMNLLNNSENLQLRFY